MEGVLLGIVVGIPSAVVFLLLMRAVLEIWKKERPPEDLKWVIAELLALPTFILGGPWFTTTLVQLFEWEEIKTPYAVTVATLFGSVGFVFLVMLAIKTGSEFWRQGEPRSA